MPSEPKHFRITAALVHIQDVYAVQRQPTIWKKQQMSLLRA